MAKGIVVSDEDREVLRRWARGRRVAARLVPRAKIVLLASGGKLNKEIAAELGMSPSMVQRVWHAHHLPPLRHQEWIKFLPEIERRAAGLGLAPDRRQLRHVYLYCPNLHGGA